MTITFTGLSSVLDRTLFTNRGPIVKRPINLLTGADLKVASETDVVILSGSFNSSTVGKLLTISGSSGGRNDGSFYVKQVVSAVRLRLENASFDISDVAKTTALVVGLANELKTKYNLHRIQSGVHGTNDTVHVVTAATAVTLGTAITLLNNIKANLNLHVMDVAGVPPVHKFTDSDDVVLLPDATGLASAVLLANDLRRKYEAHRQSRRVHLAADSINRITVAEVQVVSAVFPGPLTGPFNWVLKDPRPGIVASDPTDVSVLVNGLPAAVDAVFGLLGAVVLSAKPGPTDTVSVDYSFLNNPPSRLLRLNSPEFNLNQVGNRGHAGLPQHQYRSRSYLIDPGHSPDFMSTVQPEQIAWKYKALERAYSAVLNDPNSLLLNVPTNKLAYPVLFQTFFEQTIRYDPTSLPQNSADPWTLEGDGTFSLASGGNELTITDSNIQTGPLSKPPFFTHEIDMRAPSLLSAAFRTRVQSSVNDGVFTGVSFGVSDGQKVALIGFILTDATNLSSAITMANDAKTKFNAHLVNLGSHDPNDSADSVVLVDAVSLVTLIILANEIKTKMNLHMAKGGAGGVHVLADAVNPVVSLDAIDLASAVTLINEIRLKLNAHETQAGIHFLNDIVNVVNQVKQAGILTNRGFAEFQGNWNSASVDWTILRTYRIFMDSNGVVSLFLSGDSTPIASASALELPSISDLDGRFDPVQQVFFGPTGRESTSVSKWAFIRVNVSPIDANLVGDNKKVDYAANTTPETDPIAPWINVGQGGVEKAVSGILRVDSTASAPTQNVQALGLSSGAYRGFLRMEPILSINTACSFEFSTALDFWTHSLDNRAAGVFIDDENFSVQFCFLQFSPSPAVVTGSASEPYPMVNLDQMVISLDGAPSFTIVFFATDSTAALAAARINTAAGFALASAVSGRVKLTSVSVGVSASIAIIFGNALSKLGFSPGIYSGRDSNPEPRISWFGENLPDLDTPIWLKSGGQTSTMLSRTMRLTDASSIDYIVFSLADPVVTNQAFNSAIDWKMDCHFTVVSFIAGAFIPAAPPYIPLKFCGGLVSIDEGPAGKNVELQIAIDGSGNHYLSLLSFNPGSGALDVKAQYAFNWGDGKEHSYDVYTSKGADSMFVLADGVLLSPLIGQPLPTYSALNAGVAGPSVSFGSGSAPVTGSDMRTAQSVIDWNSVAVFRDSKIGDPSASSRRFIGLFKGGDPALLSSYYLHQIDWSLLHTYRIVRDPVSAVSVYVDGGQIPVISASYDVLTLPPVSSSFLKGVTSSHQAVAFGSFNPQEIARSRWDFIRYSIGKLTLSDRLVPYGNVTNRANAMVSPDHLFTAKSHDHAGFTIYSGGTPIDEFLSDNTVAAYTNLGEGTPPIPMTQDLESRGGLIRVVTPVESIPSIDLVNTKGFISDFENDVTDVVNAFFPVDTVATITANLVTLVNDIQTKYNIHLVSPGIHFVNDVVNTSVLPPATDLPTAQALANELKTKYNLHLIQATVHVPNDLVNAIVSPNATDLVSAVTLVNEMRGRFGVHILTSLVHVLDDAVNIVTAPNSVDIPTAAVLADDIRTQFITHAPDATFHMSPDLVDTAVVPYVAGLSAGFVAPDFITVTEYTIPVAIGDTIRFLTGPNAGLDRTIATIGIDSFTVGVPYPFADVSPSRFAKITGGQPALDTPSIIALANSLKSRFNSHQASLSFHPSSDIVNVVSSPDAFDLTTVLVLLNEAKADFNLHRSGRVYHSNPDPVDVPIGLQVQDPLHLSLDLANSILANFNAHLVRPKTHVTADEKDLVLLSSASDLASLIILANTLKANFNLHRTAFDIHVANDAVNVVASADATDLTSVVVLVNELRTRYETHRVQVGVHGSTVFIRLDPPARVLYDGMKFFKNSTGEAGHVSPFSDDETWHLDGFKAQQDQTLTFTGAALPENAQLVGDRIPPFAIVGGETLRLQVDGGATVTVTFQPGDTTAVAVVARINGTVGIPPTLASHETDGRIRLISPTAGPPSQVTVVSGSAILLLGLDVPQYTPWFIVSDDPTAVSVALMSAGPVDFMRYRTTGVTRTAYENKTGLPDSTSVRFEMTFSIRINHVFSPATNIDTGIYVGVSGIAGPLGFTAGIGFEKLGSFRYVKIQDLNSGKTLFRRAFDWSDGNFHTYQLIRDIKKNVLQLVILS